MSYRGSVIHIHIAPDQGNPMQAVESVEAVRGRGLRGDRYFQNEGTFTNRTGCDITFIEQEALIAVEREYGIKLEAGVHRRNVTTRDIALNHLVNECFQVGNVVCKGVELCEPCAYLDQHTEKERVRKALVHRGGLRATILKSGQVNIGDVIRRYRSSRSDTASRGESI